MAHRQLRIPFVSDVRFAIEKGGGVRILVLYQHLMWSFLIDCVNFWSKQPLHKYSCLCHKFIGKQRIDKVILILPSAPISPPNPKVLRWRGTVGGVALLDSRNAQKFKNAKQSKHEIFTYKTSPAYRTVTLACVLDVISTSLSRLLSTVCLSMCHCWEPPQDADSRRMLFVCQHLWVQV